MKLGEVKNKEVNNKAEGVPIEDGETSKRRTFLKGLAGVPMLAALSGLVSTRAFAYAKAGESAEAPKGKVYALEGTYMESCNCDSICPCVLLDDPTEGFCQAFVAWHIDKGHLRDVRLDGLNVAVWLHAPGNLTKGEWRMAYYFDSKGTTQQINALRELWHGEHGGYLEVIASLASENMGIKVTGIDFEVTDKGASFKVDGVGEVDIVNTEAGNGDRVLLHNTPLAVAPGHPITIAKQKILKYQDHGMDQFLSGRNGFSSPFTYHA